MAELHKVDDLETYEAQHYGQTGLRPYEDLKSEYCMRRRLNGKQRCEAAFARLIENAQAKHIILSYNEEGIISKDTICDALAQFSGVSSFDVEKNYKVVRYRRFRSDANGRNGRTYKVLEGREADRVDECLFYARAKTRRSKKKSLK